ncbi:phage tail sheath protein [Heliobacterium gestii]|uniref:Phage tail sheath protein n=1 Tax=Heliomicrobium gestii TaxID=2699 RepID=A0A845L7S1_HELGE|nr:phage tail sheath subtilisin-like domain-containing protein [Heliomicrobium gestii]MBM7866005.1 hypothetical protein [Heliomicrobium gestii]MZP42662.1 phage tail sheath protein [Heliomicrobium gestii]
MGLPSVNIIFQQKAVKAIERGSVGILAMVLKDPLATSLVEFKLSDIADMPAELTAENKEYVEHAFMGTPQEVKVVVLPAGASDYSAALNYLEAIRFNLAVFPGIAAADTTTIASWAKSMRDAKERKIQVVLPHSAADHEAVINFATDNIQAFGKTYDASRYAARIAGLIAGLPLTVAPTFRVLSEVQDVPKLSKADADAAVDAGKLILYHDGGKVKIARGVTSLVTTTEDKGADWKKIKLSRIYDMMYQDIKETIEDEYIGSVQNSYENKLLLLNAINAYYEVLEQERVLDTGKNRCAINLPAQKTYLKSIGEAVDAMTEAQLKEANTRDKVFLVSNVKGLDAIEEVQLVVNL